MIEFKLPALGADMDEGTLLEWKVGVGDTVKKGQVVAIVDTTKAAVDIESWQEGTVHQLIAEIGKKMPVGTVMALLRETGEEVVRSTTPKVGADEATALQGGRAKNALMKPLRSGAVEQSTLASPLRILAVADGEKAAAARPSPTAERPADRAADRTADMRKTIAAAMSRSKREIPHYYVAEDIPLAKALAWLQAANAQRPMAGRLLPAALLLKAVAMALKRCSCSN